MPQGPYLRKYGVQTTINFVLFEVDGVDFRVDAVDGGSDCSIMKDEGAEATCTNDFVDEGNGYSLVLTATEMQAARIVVYVVDSATKVWLDTAIIVETYGHASAMHAVDLDDSVRAGLTALPNAAADAAGGLAISDAGGLDLDAKLANTNEVTAARMGALTDWIDGGRLDLIIDAVLADTGELQTDWVNGGRLDLLIDAIKVVTDSLTDLATLADAVWDEAKAGHVAAGSFGEEVQAHSLSTEVAALNNVSAAEVNAEVVDVLETDTHAEPGSAVAATASLKDMLNWLKALARNKITQTSAIQALRNDADGADIATASVSDDGTTAIRGEWA